MSDNSSRYAPGRIRDAILQVMTRTSAPLSVRDIEERVSKVMGPLPASSIRSYLRLNTPELFVRENRGVYHLKAEPSGAQREISALQDWEKPVKIGKATLYHSDCFDWLERQSDNSIHAVVTDPTLWSARIHA